MNCDREQISAMVDGELDGAQIDAVLDVMGARDALESWRLYHMIGDVLRAPDLGACDRDLEFVTRVRVSLPVQSAPMALAVPSLATRSDTQRAAANDGVFRWKMVAGLASFAAIAVVGWASLGGLGPQAPAGDAQMALNALSAAPGTPPAVVPASRLTATAAPAVGSAAVMLRDPELDQLLAAHRQAAAGSAFGDSTGFLRNATFEGPSR